MFISHQERLEVDTIQFHRIGTTEVDGYVVRCLDHECKGILVLLLIAAKDGADLDAATASVAAEMAEDNHLHSRLKVVEGGRPQGEHFDSVYRNLPRVAAAEFGVHVEMLPPPYDIALKTMREGFGRAPNMRIIARVISDSLAPAATWRPEHMHRGRRP